MTIRVASVVVGFYTYWCFQNWIEALCLGFSMDLTIVLRVKDMLSIVGKQFVTAWSTLCSLKSAKHQNHVAR